MNKPSIPVTFVTLALLLTTTFSRAFGTDATEKKDPFPFCSPRMDVRLEEELAEKQAYSALCGIALSRVTQDTPDLSAAELNAIAHGYEVLQDKGEVVKFLRRASSGSAGSDGAETADRAVLEELNHSGEAEAPLRKALCSREKGFALGVLAKIYFDTKRFKEMAELVPDLLKHRFERENLCLKALLGYAAEGPDLEEGHEILTEALEGVSDDYLIHDVELGRLALRALQQCGFEERADGMMKKWLKQEETMPTVAARLRAYEAGRQAEEDWITRRTLASGGGAEHRPPDRNGLIVRKIEVQSQNPNTTITADALLARLETQVGQPYANWVTEDDIRNIYSTGLITNTRIFGEKLDDGLKVIVVVLEGFTR